MASQKVVILDDRFSHHDYEREVLGPTGAELIVDSAARSETEVVRAAGDADVVLVNIPPITAGVIAKLRHCRAIIRYGTGFDSVDIGAASRRGIMVVNVPDYCSEEVSDQVIALWLACIRQVCLRDRLVREGSWDTRPEYAFRRISGRVFGFFGYGRIARVLHRKLGGFSFGRILVCDPFVAGDLIRSTGAEPVDFRTLAGESDFISIHTPLTGSTRHAFNAEAFSRMKEGAILINTARGGIIDPPALAEALRTGKLLAAGLDVYETEPLPPDSPLRSLGNVVLSDHRGWYSRESSEELQKKAAYSAREVLEGKTPQHTVNIALLSREQ